MVNIFSFFVPFSVFITFLSAFLSKKDVFSTFVSGVKGVIALLMAIFPYVVTVLIMTTLMEESGLNDLLENALSPILKFFSIPPELFKLILLKPLSGSGSLAILDEIFYKYSPDSYIGKCASCIFGSSETIFYISAIYFSKCKNKRLKKGIVISLISTLISCVFACFICKFMP